MRLPAGSPRRVCVECCQDGILRVPVLGLIGVCGVAEEILRWPQYAALQLHDAHDRITCNSYHKVDIERADQPCLAFDARGENRAEERRTVGL